MSVVDLSALAPLSSQPRAVMLSDPPWPHLGPDSPLNEFYRRYVSAAGMLGESHVIFWTLEEIAEDPYEISTRFDVSVVTFASNGGGELFAAIAKDTAAEFPVVPCIGDREDTLRLGPWNDFVRKLEAGEIFQ
jgi:hypothetical protein